MTDQDARYMRLAIELAHKGLGRTAPNPAVGAVIVQAGTIVGQGYHRFAGAPHAEVEALTAAGPAARGGTLYVTLEPCNHTGRTPPCTEAILKAGIKRVVVGMADPNPTVQGGGMQRLQDSGIVITYPVEEAACRRLNHPFIKHTTTGRPWVIMKAGMSLDGRISYQRRSGGVITGSQSRLHVHQLRDQCDAILVGRGTVSVDDPALTTRLPGEGQGRDPIRVVLDSALAMSPRARMLKQDSQAPTWLLCTTTAPLDREEQLVAVGARIHRLPEAAEGGVSLDAALDLLGSLGVTSLLVEGGAAVHGALLSQHLVDELYLFVAPFFIGDQGTPLLHGYHRSSRPLIEQLEQVTCDRLGSDILVRARFLPTSDL